MKNACNYENALKAAQEIRSYYIEQGQLMVDLSVIIEGQGLKAKLVEHGNLDSLATLDRELKTILVSDINIPINFKIFPIAKEIGKWTLHYQNYLNRANGEYNQNLENLEADIFATELLMPYEDVEKLILAGHDPQHVAVLYGLPYQLVFHRYQHIFQKIVEKKPSLKDDER